MHTPPFSLLPSPSFSTAKKIWARNEMITMEEPCSSVKHEHNFTQKQICQNRICSYREGVFSPYYIICQVTLSFFTLLHNHIMKAPDVIHVHKRADLGLIRDPFVICIANRLLKNRQSAVCRRIMDKTENVLFCF